MTPDERFDRIDANIAGLKASLNQLMLDFREETARRFDVI